MPVPKRKRSRPRRDKRFANKGLKVKSFSACSNCSEPLSSHTACKHCGYYKGVKVIRVKSDRGVQRTEKRRVIEARQQQSDGATETQSSE